MEIKIDERQHLVRGRIFKHTVFVLVGLLLLEGLLHSFFGITFFEGEWSVLMIALAGIIFMCAEMVLRDAFPLTQNRRIGLFSLVGIFGVVALIIGIIDIAKGAGFTAENSLSESAAVLVMSVMYIASAAIFAVKLIKNKKVRKEDDE